MTPAEARLQFPITSSRAYLFSGGLGPAPAASRAALDRWSEKWALDPALLYAEYPTEWNLLRESVAALIGAEPQEIAITDHTARGSNLTVQMLDAPAGSNVVLDEYTYFSSFYPWRLPAKAHVESRVIAAEHGIIPIDKIAQAVDSNTIAISATHVSWQNGFRHDLAALAEIAHSNGAYLIVDAAQSAGALDIDVRKMGIDFLAFPALKWMCGTPGIGYLYIKRELAERLSPPHAGLAGVISPFGVDPSVPLVFQPGALRHEMGLPSLPGLAASRASVDLIRSVGMQAIETQVLDLSGYCIEQLKQRDFEVLTPDNADQRAGVIGMNINRSADLVAFARERGVDLYTPAPSGLLRIDPHFFNNRDDIDRLMDSFESFERQEGRAALQ